MKLRDSFDGSNRFEGDRALRWRSIPADARIVSAKATVTPVDAKLGSPFSELLSFNGAKGQFGATKAQGTAGSGTTATAWVEVDFLARRTLASLRGAFTAATLQVDVGGGTYVEINKAGAFKTPSDTGDDARFPIDGRSVSLPGLTVAKLKVINFTTTLPDVTAVIVRSVPSNVTLRVGELPPFWTHLGEMTQLETTPDFTAVLQAALLDTKIENGFYDLPILIHSDAIARLQVDLEIEFLAQQDPLPGGLQEVVLPFDFSTLPQSSSATLNVAVPPNTRVVPGQTAARVRGNFAETRVACGPTGDVKPVAAVEVSPASSQAQIIALNKDIATTAIDLLIESKTTVTRLRLDLRDDLDGKPDDASLLAAPVEISVDQQAGKGARWVSAPLSAEFVLSKAVPEKPGERKHRYWLVLQSLEGIAAWSVNRARDKAEDNCPDEKDNAVREAEDKEATTPAPAVVNMQTTHDGGLSWRDAIAMPGTLLDKTISAFTGFFRLRTQPKTFQVPIELQAGRDKSEVRIKLDRFQPLGRVDFVLDTELAQGINESLDKTPAITSPDTEHLHNVGFEQWLRVGDDVKSQPEINLDRLERPIRAVAFSPDGVLAYVLDQGRTDFLLTIDVACGRELEDKRIELRTSNPQAFVISPDGRRAYVTNGTRLQVIDLSTSERVGEPFDLELVADEQPANDLALSPDGSQLYVVTFGVIPPPVPPLVLPPIPAPVNRIRVIDTARLEQQLTTGVPAKDLMPLHDTSADTNQTISPRAVTVSPDGSLLYMVTDRGANTSEVRTVDTKTFVLLTPNITIGHTSTLPETPTALALSLDGTQLLVANVGDNNVSIIDTATGSSALVNVTQPIGVAISPDGQRAYVLNKRDKRIRPVDLARRTLLPDFPSVEPALAATRVPVALALAPQGDQIYVANNISATNSSVSSIQFGTRLPSEWNLTSGAVTPFCLDVPFHLVAVLGSDTMPTGLSQVAPVAESSLYEFSFWGIAREADTNEPPAVAEVLWRGGDCGPLGSPDPIPIKLIEAPPVVPPPSVRSATLFSANGAGRTASLALHRARLTAPAGAAQAEVRFTVPTGGTAAIDQVSLIATSDAAVNGDFKLLQNGQLVGWTVAPGVAPGFTVLAAAEGIQLRNSGAALVELVQVAAAKSGGPFTLEFEGKAVAGSPSPTNPRVELHWLKADGTASGSPTIVEILPDGLASSSATGTAPGDATQVEIHLGVPAGTTLEVKRVSLRFSTPTNVPLTFIAQAPGELTVSDIRVAFEQVEATPPAIPPRGLCLPTAPGRQPGEAAGDCCFCHHCESEQSVIEAANVLTPAGRPAMMALCANCGNELLRVGGPRVEGAQPLALVQPAVLQPIVIPSSVTGERPQVAAVTARLTDISGIGEARAKQLVDIGIDSVDKLAGSTPETVAKMKFITLEMASRIVMDAKSLVAGSGRI